MSWIKTFGLFLLLQVPASIVMIAIDQPAILIGAGAVIACLYVVYLLLNRKPIRSLGRLLETTSAASAAMAVGFGVTYGLWLPSETPAVRESDWLVGLIVTGLMLGATVALMSAVFVVHFLLSRSWRGTSAGSAA